MWDNAMWQGELVIMPIIGFFTNELSWDHMVCSGSYSYRSLITFPFHWKPLCGTWPDLNIWKAERTCNSPGIVDCVYPWIFCQETYMRGSCHDTWCSVHVSEFWIRHGTLTCPRCNGWFFYIPMKFEQSVMAESCPLTPHFITNYGMMSLIRQQ